MNSYRIYGLDAQGRILHGEYCDCPDDDEAIGQARRLLERYQRAEVWFGRRRVAGPTEVSPPEA